MDFDKYIETYGRCIYGLCITLCSGRGDPDDLYQETWLRAFEKYSQYTQSMPFEGWLTAICVNLYRDGLRHLKRQPATESLTDYETGGEKDVASDSDGQRYTALRQAVDRLPEKLRLTVILFYFRDADLKSIALALKIPEGTVKSRLAKARDVLRKELEDETDIRF